MSDRSEDTLLGFSEIDMHAADLMLKNLTGDEQELNVIAYHLQQALEKCIKFQLEMKGVNYKDTHDIEDLLDSSKDIKVGMNINLRAELASMSSWEFKTRYIKGYRVELESIKHVMPLIQEHIEKVKAEEKARVDLLIKEQTAEFD